MSKNNENNVARERLRSMSLGELVKMVDGSTLKSGLINTAFDKEKNPLLVRRILNVSNFNNDKEKSFQDEYIKMFSRTVTQTMETVAQSSEKEAEVQKQFEEAESVYLKAKAEYEAAKAKLESAKRATDYANTSLHECEDSWKKAIDQRANMDKVLLVHISSTTSQLERYGDYKMVVSYEDSKVLMKLGIVDEVFDEEKARLVDVSSDYPSFYQDKLKTDMSSKIAYARMVAWYMLNDIPYELAYADKVIYDILVHNGLI